MAHNIGKLQHRSTDALADQTAPAVFPEAGYGKAHHLTAAAHDCRAGGQPLRSSIIHKAAELIGAVSTMPTMTETRIPMGKGVSWVAELMTAPRPFIMAWMPGPTSWATAQPLTIVVMGLTIISTLVLPATSPADLRAEHSADVCAYRSAYRIAVCAGYRAGEKNQRF